MYVSLTLVPSVSSAILRCKTPMGQQIQIVKGNILDEQVDAIVNSANEGK